jgi:D-glycerate 3-kinase
MNLVRVSELVVRACQSIGLDAPLNSSIFTAYDILLKSIVSVRNKHVPKPIVVGICGSQGSGKSTIARCLKELLEAEGLSVVVLSLDDLYYSRATRKLLAELIHPLLQTRGVPGTHDVVLGARVLTALLSASKDSTTPIPRFNKALDEPLLRSDWDVHEGRVDVVLFEGWCVGATPQPDAALTNPINDLERSLDPSGVWRRYANVQLATTYGALFGLIHFLVMLRAPSIEVVYGWRQEQEEKLRSAITSSLQRVMNREELRTFVAHYERLTRDMLNEMPGRADLVVDLDRFRNVTGVRAKDHPF